MTDIDKKYNYDDNGIPKRFQQLEAWTNGKELIILGNAPDEEIDPECKIHNCDAMGCGAFGPHVLIRYKVDWEWLINKEK